MRKSQRLSEPDGKLSRSPFEKDGLSNCRKLIRDPNSKLSVCPTTKKRYIRNVDLSINVILNKHSMDWVNHTYYYPILLSPVSSRRIEKIFDKNMEKRVANDEQEILANVGSSLTQIFTKINL